MTGHSNGDLDPWSAGGVLESPSPSLVTIVIKDAAHHLDLRSSNPNDTADVIAARKKEKAVVRDWLQQYWNRPQSSTQQVDYSKTTASTQLLLLGPPLILLVTRLTVNNGFLR